MDDRGGHIGERARKERLRLTDGVSQNERIESLSHEVNCDRVALIGRKLAESAAGKDDHRGAASGEDVRGQRHVGTCGIEDNGFCFHLVKFLAYEDARADIGASDFMLRFAQCTRGSKVRDESCGTDSVRMYGRRTVRTAREDNNGIFPRLQTAPRTVCAMSRATRRLTVYRNIVLGRQSGELPHFPTSREDFQKARGSVGRFPRIFSVITDGSFYRSGNLCLNAARAEPAVSDGIPDTWLTSPYVLGSYPARAGAVEIMYQ